MKKETEIIAIILAGSRDFGRCPIASYLPPGLWPVGEKPAVARLLKKMSDGSVSKAYVCSYNDADLFRRHIGENFEIPVEFVNEQMPDGTAGCIRNVARDYPEGGKLFLVVHASMAALPDIRSLKDAHDKGNGAATIFFEPNETDQYQQAGIYMMDQEVTKYTPEKGYFDIKEELLPAMLLDGNNADCVHLQQSCGVFSNRSSYLEMVAKGFSSESRFFDIPEILPDSVIKQPGVQIGDNVKFAGPVWIMENSRIDSDSLICGPTIIGRNVQIGRGAFISRSVLWDNVLVGDDSQLIDCLAAEGSYINNSSTVKDKGIIGRVKSRDSKRSKSLARLKQKINKKIPAAGSILQLTGLALLIGLFLWSYWPEISELLKVWTSSDEYSSGMLVPFLAAYVLYTRRDKLKQIPVKTCYWGIGLLAVAELARHFGLFFMYSSAQRLSVVIAIIAIAIILFGWKMFKATLPISGFMFLMIPFPKSIDSSIMMPLQEFATTSAVFLLEMLGYGVIRQGNIITIGQTTVAVAEACNGLRMITAFIIIVATVALIIDRSWWEKGILLLSSLPIAILANSVRLTITTIAFTKISAQDWEQIFHDFGGYAMMPIALMAVILELWLINRITTEPPQKTQTNTNVIYARS